MSSLLTQMRPAASEQVERRHGSRKYQPEYRLSRYVTVPTEKQALDPKPPPYKLRTEGLGSPNPLYLSPHGPLSGDVKEQFARHFQWKTASQLSYTRHHPSIPPLPSEAGQELFQPRANMLRTLYPGLCTAGGPFDFQKVVASRAQVPENKVWPRVQPQYHPFPNNAYPGDKFFRGLKHNIGGRTPEEFENVKNHIRHLVKEDKLNTQFVKPTPRYQGLQDEVRVYESLDRPPGRNPADMSSEYMAQFDRYIPSQEYRRPRFSKDQPLSKTVVRPDPYNHFNHREYPDSLDYLPLPYNLTRTPHDLRLI